MTLDLAADRKRAVMDHLQRLFADEFDETLTDFRAEQVLELMLKTLGPQIYNQAVQDVRTHLQSKLDDLEGEVWLDEG